MTSLDQKYNAISGHVSLTLTATIVKGKLNAESIRKKPTIFQINVTFKFNQPITHFIYKYLINDH